MDLKFVLDLEKPHLFDDTAAHLELYSFTPFHKTRAYLKKVQFMPCVGAALRWVFPKIGVTPNHPF